ncbi:MAG: T9SS type A sorting domain-containing protein [Bacteroidota bacterium]
MKYLNTFLLRKQSLILLFCLGSFFASWQTAQACVDPDTIATVTVNYDSAMRQVEIRVSNLRLMTEAPNTFCSCAVSSYSDVFTDLLYVAFVDSGTNQPYQGFAQWGDNLGASSSWDASTSGYPSWNGYVAEVVNSGLSPGNPVDLLIRAELPPGYTVSFLDSAISSTFIGTDEWDPATQSLTNSHQGLHSTGQLGYTLTEQDSTYFTAVDDAIEAFYSSTSIDREALLEAYQIGPNPFQDRLTIRYEADQLTAESLHLLDAQGRMFLPVFQEVQVGSQRLLQLDFQDHQLPSGVYVLRFAHKETWLSVKLLKE